MLTKDLEVGMLVRNEVSEDEMKVLGIDKERNLYFLCGVSRGIEDPSLISVHFQSLGMWFGEDLIKWVRINEEK